MNLIMPNISAILPYQVRTLALHSVVVHRHFLRFGMPLSVERIDQTFLGYMLSSVDQVESLPSR